MCEKYGMKYIPELHLSGQAWFHSKVVERLAADPGELYIYSRLGTSARGGGNWFSSTWNPLHPAIQDKYIKIVGALADKAADSPAFGGVSSRLMSWVWQGWNGLPSLNWGYGDWTVAQFEKDTGLKVPGDKADPDRFSRRFAFLTEPKMIDRWIGWRNARMIDYYKRIRDRIREANPSAVLYLPYYGDAEQGMDLIFGSYFQTPKGALREIGLDLDVLAKIPGISVMPSGSYGRRDGGNVVADARIADSVADPALKELGFAFERAFAFGNAYFEDQPQIPMHQIGFPDWDINQKGGNNGSAEGAGRNVIEKLAYALADQDSSTLRQGGMGYNFGQPAEYNEFLSVYERLPKMPFTAWDKARDPVAVWFAQVKHPGLFGGSTATSSVEKKFPEGLYFYAVNREPYAVEFTVELADAGDGVEQLGAERVALTDGRLSLKLKPYEIVAFRAAKNARLAEASVVVPRERIELIRDRLAYCQQLGGEITDGLRRNDLSADVRDRFIGQLETAWDAAGEKHWWRARTAMTSQPTVTVFNRLAAWPKNLLQRRMGLGLLSTAPTGSLGGDEDRRKPAPMIAAEALAKQLAPGVKATLVDASAYDPAWAFTKVVRSDDGTLRFRLDVPVPAIYQLSLGHVASDYGAMTVELASKGMSVLAQTKTPGKAEKTIFPALKLPAGKTELVVSGQSGYGVYGVTLQPLHRCVPSPLWTTTGPFPSPWYPGGPGEMIKDSMLRVDPPMEEIKADATYTVDGKTLRWSWSDEIRGGVPHFDPLAGTSHLFRSRVQQRAVCYAVTRIESPEERDADILIGCDWWANAWLNGKQLTTDRPAKHVEGDGCYFNGWTPYAARVHLKKGVNILLVKSHGGTVANWFTCYISDLGDLNISPLDKKDHFKISAAGAPAERPDYPGSRMLTGKYMSIEVMDPNAEKRYNTGVRFTPVAAVIRAKADGHEFLMHTDKQPANKAVAGLFAEFDLVTSPPGFDEAKIGEPHVKIGVGALVKDKERYSFWSDHKVFKRATTTVNWQTSSAYFTQTLDPISGYGYKLTATTTVDGATLVIDWTLANTGTKPFETHQYLHNSFSFDNAGLKPDTVLSFPFDFAARKLAAEQQQVGREIRFIKQMTKPVNIEVDYPADYKGPNTLRVVNSKQGFRIDAETSIPGSRVALHASPEYICPEQFVIISLKPGESKSWQRRYTFGLLSIKAR